MRRIAIIGNGGGGKSLLARDLSRALAVPVHTVDNVQWQAGWVRAPLDVVARAHADWLASSGWVIDGWGTWELLEQRFSSADTIIFVDFPLWRHCWWALKRQAEVTLGLRHDWPPPGCKALPITGRLLGVLMRVHREHRPQLVAMLSDPRFRSRVVHVRSPRELLRFKRQVLGQAATAG